MIGTTGYTGRELFAVEDRSNQLYMVGSMGCASSFALGVSLARPDLDVTVVDGDGAGLMRMGNFATIGSYGRNNLAHVLLDNGVHESTGSQATVSANVSFADIAAACGYGLALDGNDPAVISELYARKDVDGARFASPEDQTGHPRRPAPPRHLTGKRPAPADQSHELRFRIIYLPPQSLFEPQRHTQDYCNYSLDRLLCLIELGKT